MHNRLRNLEPALTTVQEEISRLKQDLDIIFLDIEASNKREVDYITPLEASSKKFKDMEQDVMQQKKKVSIL